VLAQLRLDVCNFSHWNPGASWSSLATLIFCVAEICRLLSPAVTIHHRLATHSTYQGTVCQDNASGTVCVLGTTRPVEGIYVCCTWSCDDRIWIAVATFSLKEELCTSVIYIRVQRRIPLYDAGPFG
jgi:hypothetical protein